MPIYRCTDGGSPGYRWGDSGKCYTYRAGCKSCQDRAKASAQRQGVAAMAAGYEAVQSPSASQRTNLPPEAYAAPFYSDEGEFLSSMSKLPHHINTVKDGSSDATVDVPRLRNAMARFGQVDWSSFPDGAKTRARAHLERHADSLLYLYKFEKGSNKTTPALALDLKDFRDNNFAAILGRLDDS